MQSVSIVICTYNRAAVLADTLETLAAAVPAYLGPLEILVVNNASTDSTEEVVINFMRKQPSLTINVVYEKQPGLSFARNAGLVHARGDIICFIDDDVLVPAGWLPGLLQAFEFGDRIGCVAGRITLHWPDLPIPKWLDNKYCGVLSEFNCGEKSFVLDRGGVFIGANFAITREAASAVGLFKPELGRKGNILLSGEDTNYSQRLWEHGFSTAYSAEGHLYHRVLPEQLTYSWFCRRYFWAGVTTHVLRQKWYYPLSGVCRALTCSLLFLAGVILMNQRRIVRSTFRIINTAGAFYGWYVRTAKN